MLRNIQGPDSQRFDRWIEHVASANPNVSALNLYSGDRWHVALQIAESLPIVELWVLSAGMGLLPANTLIPAYSATLTAGSLDSVARLTDTTEAREIRRTWWAHLCAWEGPAQDKAPRSIASLARSKPNGRIMVSAGKEYVDAILPDLLDTTEALEAPEHLLILGSGKSPHPLLTRSWIPIPGKFRGLVGGTMGSLSIRAAEWILTELGASLDAERARQTIAQAAKVLPELRTPQRRPMSDDEVHAWVVEELDENPTLAKTAALRRLRKSGLACEQSRFGRLFNEVLLTSINNSR